jgi:hypothetical protein
MNNRGRVESGPLVQVTHSEACPTTRRRAGCRSGLDHVSGRVGFGRAQRRPSGQVNHHGYRVHVGGSRFLEVDPVEGGCSNDYTYVHGDPVNSFDLTGAVTCPASGKSITIRGQYGFVVTIRNSGNNRFDVKANYSGVSGWLNSWRAEDTWIQIRGRRTNGARFKSGIVQTSDKIAGGRASYPRSWGHVGAPALQSGSTLDVTAWSPWYRSAWLPGPGAPVAVTGVMVSYRCTVS